MSEQRRKVVMLGAATACMGIGPIVLQGNPRLVAVWLGIMAAMLVLTIMQFVKLKGQER